MPVTSLPAAQAVRVTNQCTQHAMHGERCVRYTGAVCGNSGASALCAAWKLTCDELLGVRAGTRPTERRKALVEDILFAVVPVAQAQCRRCSEAAGSANAPNDKCKCTCHTAAVHWVRHGDVLLVVRRVVAGGAHTHVELDLIHRYGNGRDFEDAAMWGQARKENESVGRGVGSVTGSESRVSALSRGVMFAYSSMCFLQ